MKLAGLWNLGPWEARTRERGAVCSLQLDSLIPLLGATLSQEVDESLVFIHRLVAAHNKGALGLCAVS